MAVIYLSRVFQTWDHYVASLLATAIVAVAFAPLKEWLQRQINRLMKGRHDDPYAVLLELGNQLIQPQDPDAMLNAVVRTVKDALRIPYTAIYTGISGQTTLVASAGSLLYEQHVLPIIHRGKELGMLHIASRSAGEGFTADDNKFLDVLLRQAGPIVENWHMTQGMRLRIRMPGLNGIEATRVVKEKYPHIHVLILTMFRDDQSVFTAMRVGAKGYVLKDADEIELLQSVRMVGNGGAVFSSDMRRA